MLKLYRYDTVNRAARCLRFLGWERYRERQGRPWLPPAETTTPLPTTYTGRPFDGRMGLIRRTRVRASWYTPRDGSLLEIREFANTGTTKFTPPGTPRPGNDWTLVLDDAAAQNAPSHQLRR